jgi:alpha-1,6-mannosyltransferase
MTKPSGDNPLRLTFLYASTALLFTASAVIGFGECSFPQWVLAVMLFSVGGGIFVLCTAYAWRRASLSTWLVVLIFMSGAAFRLLTMQASRELSDDAARYHWDGKVLVAGINPYIFSPNDPHLRQLEMHAIDTRINHPHVKTVYPPLSEILFAVGYLLSPGRLTGFQLLCLAAELGTWLLLLGELRRRNTPIPYLILATWSTLLLFEGYLPGHLDLLGLPFLTLFLIHTERKNPLRSGVFLGLSCLIEPLPLIFIPAAVRELGLRRSIRLLCALLFTVTLFYLPFLDAGRDLFGSMWLMATKWSVNSSVSGLLELLLPMTTAHIISSTLLVVLLTFSLWWPGDLLSRMLMAFASFVICTSTLFPWYLAWVVPFLVLRPDPALLSLTITAGLFEEVTIGYGATGDWEPALWPRLLEYSVFYALLFIGIQRHWGMFQRLGSEQGSPNVDKRLHTR